MDNQNRDRDHGRVGPPGVNAIGDQATTRYDHEQHRGNKATLQRLTANLNKLPEYRGPAIEAVLKLGDTPARLNTVPMIEVFRSSHGRPMLWPNCPSVVALASASNSSVTVIDRHQAIPGNRHLPGDCSGGLLRRYGLSFPHSLKCTDICDCDAFTFLPTVPRTMNILFLCTGNSCRSILAEATFNHLAPPGWSAMSAGSQPTGQVHPRSLALLERERIRPTACIASRGETFPRLPT